MAVERTSRETRRLGKYGHLIVWTKPPKPSWMNEETYVTTIPETLDLRELRYAIVEKGKRTKSITVVTTMPHQKRFMGSSVKHSWRFKASLSRRSSVPAWSCGDRLRRSGSLA